MSSFSLAILVALAALNGAAAYAQEVSPAAQEDFKTVELKGDPAVGDTRRKLNSEILNEAKRFDDRRKHEHTKSRRRVEDSRGRDTGLDRAMRETVGAWRAGKLSTQ
jgi:hypothetical protein